MAKDKSGRRVAYDKFWGGILALTCVLPFRLDGESYLWDLYERHESRSVRAWLILGSVAGVAALVMGIWGWRGRVRHFVNFALGTATLAVPVFLPRVWRVFPETDPAELPLSELGSIGSVMLLALAAIYAGSGIRVVRPAQVAGQALGALGALLLAVFAFLPMEGHEVSYAVARVQRLPNLSSEWRQLVPFALIAGAGIVGTFNLLRTKAEVVLAKTTRLLLVAGALWWIALPFAEGGGTLAGHVPSAWGGLRLLAPFFLALDGAVAFVAISITRSSE